MGADAAAHRQGDGEDRGDDGDEDRDANGGAHASWYPA